MLASPCINVCEMEQPSGLCRGCLRTLDEIARWSRSDDNTRRAILAQIDQRRRERPDPGNPIAIATPD